MHTPHETLAQKRKRYREQVAITIPPDCMHEYIPGSDNAGRRDTFVVHGVPPAFAGAAAQDRAARTATYKVKCVNRGWIRTQDARDWNYKGTFYETYSAHPCLGRCMFHSNFKQTTHHDCVYENAKS